MPSLRKPRTPGRSPALRASLRSRRLRCTWPPAAARPFQGTCSRRSRLGSSRSVSRAERVLDELDDHALWALAVERLRPPTAERQHLGERLIAGRDHAPARLLCVVHLKADVGEAVIALAAGDRLALGL